MVEFFCESCANVVEDLLGEQESLSVGALCIRCCVVCSFPVDTARERYSFFRYGTYKRLIVAMDKQEYYG